MLNYGRAFAFEAPEQGLARQHLRPPALRCAEDERKGARSEKPPALNARDAVRQCRAGRYQNSDTSSEARNHTIFNDYQPSQGMVRRDAGQRISGWKARNEKRGRDTSWKSGEDVKK